MGTPEFAVPSLKAVAAEYEVAAVVTQPDRRGGRGQRYSYSSVKTWAVKRGGLPVLQPPLIRSTEAVEQLEELGGADLFVVVAFGQIIPPAPA